MDNKKVALAVGCHPDDIEFMMSGTLMRLKDVGYEIHYMNLANGSCGSQNYSAEKTAQIRREESIKATELIGAIYHESIAYDLEVFYNKELLSKMASIIRDVKPEIILTHSPIEYMEDHSNTCRLVVSGAFTRGMQNFAVSPSRAITTQDVTIYHALPYGLRDLFNKPVTADFYIDIESKINAKKDMLALHQTQKEWLDQTQGLDSYLETMQKMCADMGVLSKQYKFAEGWTRHLPLGFCSEDADPLSILK